jgi:hypothetical protein
MAPKYDIHLSAYEIGPQTISDLEDLGFVRDEFANNTRCDATQYHGTYRGLAQLPDDSLWDQARESLNRDEIFSGGLEEEVFDEAEVQRFNGGGKSLTMPPRMNIIQPPPNVYKACDLHINVDLAASTNEGLRYLEALQVASFDRPQNGAVHRVFTITFETYEDGLLAFDTLHKHLKEMRGLVGKMKLEKTVRFYRKPSNAPSLPLTTNHSFRYWLSEFDLTYES